MRAATVVLVVLATCFTGALLRVVLHEHAAPASLLRSGITARRANVVAADGGAESHKHPRVTHAKRCVEREVTVEERRVRYVRIDPPGNARGLVLLFHGCSHSSRDFCAPSTECAACRGLPQEMQFVSAALNRSFVVVAVSSRDRASGCWSPKRPYTENHDVINVLSVVKAEGLDELRVITMGASSGGGFAPLIAKALLPRLIGTIPQIAAALVPRGVRVAWSTMVRDKRTMAAVTRLAKQSHDHCVFRHMPRAVDADFIIANGGNVSHAAAAAIAAAMRTTKFVDDKGHLLHDPRHSAWRKSVREVLTTFGVHDNLAADRSPISEAMNVAFGMHEFTAENAAAMLEFLLTGSCAA
jgi:alpha-beta hydrolase superfamily lysophospholipase